MKKLKTKAKCSLWTDPCSDPSPAPREQKLCWVCGIQVLPQFLAAELSLGQSSAFPGLNPSSALSRPCREDQEGLRSLRNGASQTQVTVAPCGLQRFWGHPALLRARGHSLIPPLFPLSPHSLQLSTLPANSSSPGSSSNTPLENKNLKEIHLSLRMLTHFGVRSTGFKEQRHFWEEEEEPSRGSPRRGWFWLWCLREVPVT